MDSKPHPQVGVGCIVVRGDELLLVRRRGAHGHGSWSTPGGYLEFGEPFETCAARETSEETGVGVTAVRFFAATNDVFHEEEKHFVTIWMQAEYVGGEPRISDESTEVMWFQRDALPEHLFLPLRNLIQDHGLPE